MEKLQLVGLNEYTDEKNYELVIRKVDDLIWGFYRNADHKGTVSDSQFDIGRKNGSLEDDAIQEWLTNKLSLYAIVEEMSFQF